MKKWVLISTISLFIVVGAVSYAIGVFNGAKSVTQADTLAPCPFTSTIPNNAQAVANANANAVVNNVNNNPTPAYSAPVYNNSPVYNPPVYAPTPASPNYAPNPAYAAPNSNPVVLCPRGETPNPSFTACVPVVIPAHAHLSIFGDTYDCDPGFNSFGNTCVADPFGAQQY